MGIIACHIKKHDKHATMIEDVNDDDDEIDENDNDHDYCGGGDGGGDHGDYDGGGDHDDCGGDHDDCGEENDGASGCSPLNLCRSEWRTFRAEKPP